MSADLLRPTSTVENAWLCCQENVCAIIAESCGDRQTATLVPLADVRGATVAWPCFTSFREFKEPEELLAELQNSGLALTQLAMFIIERGVTVTSAGQRYHGE